MIRKTLYPKTKRISDNSSTITVTEKLDGSNIGFFRLNGDLIIAQRNYIIKYSQLKENPQSLYKGLYAWLQEKDDKYGTRGEALLNSMHDGSGFFAEWIGMGQIKYKDFDKRVYMFAKANISEQLDAYNIVYKHDLFIYPFVEQVIPDYIGVVPIVTTFMTYPTISELNDIYDKYSTRDDKVEGFVVEHRNTIQKYVRMKGGLLHDHKT